MRSVFICNVKRVEWLRMKQTTPATPDESDPRRMSVESVCWMLDVERSGGRNVIGLFLGFAGATVNEHVTSLERAGTLRLTQA